MDCATVDADQRDGYAVPSKPKHELAPSKDRRTGTRVRGAVAMPPVHAGLRPAGKDEGFAGI